ncbi:MAG: DUF11 domain-containing protein [Marinicella sp.]
MTIFQPLLAGTLFADLMVNKEVLSTEGQNYFVDDQIEYVITVSNLDDTNDVNDVTVLDSLPPQITYLEDDCGGTLTNSSWTWHVEGALVALSQESCRITVVINQSGLIENVAEVFLNEAGAEDPELSNNSSTASLIAFEPVLLETDLAIWSVLDDETFTEGQTTNLPIQVTNLGPESIASSLVSLVLPAAITVSGANCEMNVNAQTVTWLIEDELTADQSVTCDMSILLSEAGDFILAMNVESLDLNTIEINSDNNQLSLSLIVSNEPTGAPSATPVPALSVFSIVVSCLLVLIVMRSGEDNEH